MRVEIDRDKCIGAGDCVEEAPTVFELDSFGKAVLLDPKSVDDGKLLAAARSCPVDAIAVFDDNGNRLYP
ncbi:ferredoxin [Dehalogenimonas formicexedens]|uniref:Ferredoxin n=1 Tax=Dehalogenimonas formicexedens TaxID=1839801 RepID=A0A1P8F836_9CHLR|nr:ferredoxin [Dehalogenimonas formicexedens]APV44639.1 ferredoxin [Dehalogenimonas formicexedens]